mmetsp:Transcript_42533/g.113571  ORF Transcript_42533/g.113571 Transcript_42533/m.113571 type:complete len:285 (+) Transcript_42533:329-1183(+)
MAAAEEYHPSPNTPDERRVLHVTLMPENKAQAKQKGYKASQATVGWYPGSSNTSIKRCVAVALGLRADVGSRLKVHQDEGRKRPLNLSSSDASMASMAFVTIGDESAAGDDDAGEEKLGEGTNVLRRRHGGGGSRNEGWALTDQPPPDDAAGSGGWLFENVKKTAKTTDWVDTAGNTAAFASVLNTLQNLPTNDLPEDPAFQGAYIKFERVLSHLANERTWLAWVRASLTLLSNAFTIYSKFGTIATTHTRATTPRRHYPIRSPTRPNRPINPINRSAVQGDRL